MSPSQPLSQEDHGLAALEAAVMELQLSGDAPAMESLRKQWRASTIVNREFTGVGFYTTLEVPPAVPAVEGFPVRCFGDVEAEIEGLFCGTGFIIWIKDGRLECLEGYSYQENWPDTVGRFRLWRDPNLAAGTRSLC